MCKIYFKCTVSADQNTHKTILIWREIFWKNKCKILYIFEDVGEKHPEKIIPIRNRNLYVLNFLSHTLNNIHINYTFAIEIMFGERFI